MIAGVNTLPSGHLRVEGDRPTNLTFYGTAECEIGENNVSGEKENELK